MTSILTIGNFDGLHIGHRELISTTISLARSWGARAVAITFTPHPRQFFHPSKHFFIQPQDVREQILDTLGLDDVLYLPFADIRMLSPQAFFDSILLPLEPAAIVLGENFYFGAHKAGDISMLRQMCAQHDIALHSLTMARWQGSPVSSTRIRTAIQTGHMSEAAAMLGMPYTLYGTVEHGANRGHKLGFATANIHTPEQVMPALGAYATHVKIDHSPESRLAMTAVTNTPTFQNVQTVVETHILDFSADLYGHAIQIQFDAFLRPEIAFQSRDALIRQLQDDCQNVRDRNYP
ncbi:MAG: riboflavin biosynthesis protein RibF [Proteobacteria bacterium]|nr:riboflavin biosynthesis protein RibF [Pseudomonadota bacterium]